MKKSTTHSVSYHIINMKCFSFMVHHRQMKSILTEILGVFNVVLKLIKLLIKQFIFSLVHLFVKYVP